LRIQTVTTNADGITPTKAEQDAANSIRANKPNDRLALIPKEDL
jgi:filamentous hemagglutinin